MITGAQGLDTGQRRELGTLVRALRRHLEWQRELGADGAPRPEAAQIGELAARIEDAQRRRDAALRQSLSKPEKTTRPPARNERAIPVPKAAAPVNGEPVEARSNKGGLYKAMALRHSLSQFEAVTRKSSSGSKQLDIVRQKLGDCTQCKLSRSRTRIVFGSGNPDAELLFIGEAPGFHEDRDGRPFVSKAGQLLSKMIVAMGFEKGDVYICNIIKCRPPGGRSPDREEIATCKPFAIEQIQAVRPKIIVALGEAAAQSLLRTEATITKLRGRWHRRQGFQVMPTLHPAQLLRDPNLKKLVWDDLQAVLKALKATQ